MKNVFVRKNFVLLFGHENYFQTVFQCALPVFDVFNPFLVFVLLGPCLSFSSSKFKLILKRFGRGICFSSEKMCYFVLKIISKQFSFFLLFLTFLIDFQLLWILAVLVVSQQVLNDLNRFGRVQSKKRFL